jgi:hypothetical protein
MWLNPGLFIGPYPFGPPVAPPLRPWAMAPIVNATKPVATTIAAFDSIDNFITFPFCYGGNLAAPFLIFPFSDRFESQCAYGCAAAE